MELTSCLYETSVMHCRTRPKKHRFVHKFFMFYINLDELADLGKKSWLISHNRFNVYSFFDKDHFDTDGHTIKEKVLKFLKTKNIEGNIDTVMLLTNLRTFGYVFNPVSFYFCFDKDKRPICVVPEIHNTFGEVKPFLLGKDNFKNNQFISQQKKFFYISPFVDFDVPMDFNLKIPNSRLDIQIDDYDQQGKFLYATMTGKKIELNNRNLLWYTLKFPLVTLKVIFLIHFHAMLLWLKKIPHKEKDSDQHLQREAYRVRSRKNKFSHTT